MIKSPGVKIWSLIFNNRSWRNSGSQFWRNVTCMENTKWTHKNDLEHYSSLYCCMRDFSTATDSHRSRFPHPFGTRLLVPLKQHYNTKCLPSLMSPDAHAMRFLFSFYPAEDVASLDLHFHHSCDLYRKIAYSHMTMLAWAHEPNCLNLVSLTLS